MAQEEYLKDESLQDQAEAETTADAVKETVEPAVGTADEEVAEQTEEISGVEASDDGDDSLVDLSAEDEMDIEFEIEDTPKKQNRITEAVQQAYGNLQEKCGEAKENIHAKSGELRDTVQERFDEARTACKNLMDRLSYDMEQTDYNPYIRSTKTYRYEILRKADDEEPVDVFEFQRKSGYSLHAMALTSLFVAAADLTVAKLIHKKFHS